MKNIIIYTIHPDEWPCEYCDKAKAWLIEREMWFKDVPMFVHERARFYNEHGLAGKSRTMPQIFIDGVRIGGFTELVKMEDL